jgi:hypothetical protein
MKNWQFCMMTAAIYVAPVSERGVNAGIAVLFLVLGFAAMLKDSA